MTEEAKELPANVYRPSDDDWRTSEWPEPFTVRTQEWREHLPLRRLGGHLTEMPPGHRSGPLHAHSFEEEVFVVLDGELTARELDGGADVVRRYAVRAGELVVYAPGTGVAHESRNAGDAVVRYLGLSDEAAGEVATYPESGKVLVRGLATVGVLVDGEDAEDAEGWLAEANEAASARSGVHMTDGERPAHCVSGVEERSLGDALWGRRLSAAGGATKVMVNRDRLGPGGVTSPLHWHSGDEEIVVVLAGTPTLRQARGTPPEAREWPPPGAPDFRGGDEELVGLAPGDVVCFGPHLPLAHQLRNDSAADCELLVVGLDDPQDVTVFPERGRVWVKALDRAGVLTETGYFAGE